MMLQYDFLKNLSQGAGESTEDQWLNLQVTRELTKNILITSSLFIKIQITEVPLYTTVKSIHLKT